ncbi:hypothetical protein [Methylocaldum szegediense]|uniref:hypothetical protein n=1 Tax=Methylocaldum szegediense TaxID=73780 RepID=UPI00295EF244|nr:hypothetical protein [Methylocaldum szegediense]
MNTPPGTRIRPMQRDISAARRHIITSPLTAVFAAAMAGAVIAHSVNQLAEPTTLDFCTEKNR